MAVLCQLAKPQDYRPFDWDLGKDPVDFDYWLGLFASFPDNIERQLRADDLSGDDFESRWPAFRAEYDAGIRARRADPDAFGGMTTIKLCEFRQSMLNKFGWRDPYIHVKRRENDIARSLYPDVIARVDTMPAKSRWEWLLRCLFAGNMFDLGAPKTIEMFNHSKMDFFAILERIPARPWFIDDADEIQRQLDSWDMWRQVLFFVDNAGSDIMLGVMPLVREMARTGLRVVLAANSAPALNDITIDELNVLLQQLGDGDAVLADLMATGRIATVASGGGIPLIDLSQISDACNAAAADSDLIVLEGMGRGVESNWRQIFKCDVWRVALIKDESVARWIGSKVFEPVCRFDPAAL